MAMTRDYLDYLDDQATITPANSQEEYQAAQTILGLMAEHGIDCTMEEFDSPASGRRAYQVLFIAEFLGVVLAGIDNGWARFAGVALVAVAFVLLVLERSGRHVLAGFGGVGRSQNVVAYHRASGPLVEKGSRPIVVVAHYDSGRESPLYTTSLARYLVPMRRNTPVLVAAGAVCALVQSLLFLPFAVRLVVWVMGIVAALPLLVLGAGELVASSAPFTPGVNDNKSSVAAMLGVLEDVYPTGTTHELSGRRALEEQEEQLDADEAAVAGAIEQDVPDDAEASPDGASDGDVVLPGPVAEGDEPPAGDAALGEPTGADASVAQPVPAPRVASRRVPLPWEAATPDDGSEARDDAVAADETDVARDAEAADAPKDTDGRGDDADGRGDAPDATGRQDGAADAVPEDRPQAAAPTASVPSFMATARATQAVLGGDDDASGASGEKEADALAAEPVVEADAPVPEYEAADEGDRAPSTGEEKQPAAAAGVPAADVASHDEDTGSLAGAADDADESRSDTSEDAGEAPHADANDPFALPGYEWPPIAEYEAVGAPSERVRLSVDEERVIPFGDDSADDEAGSTTNLGAPEDASSTAALQVSAGEGQEAPAQQAEDGEDTKAEEAGDGEPEGESPSDGGHEAAGTEPGDDQGTPATSPDAKGQVDAASPGAVRHGAEVIERLGILPPSCEIDYVEDEGPDADTPDGQAAAGPDEAKDDAARPLVHPDPHATSVENGAGTARDYLNLFLDPLEIEVVEPDEVKASTEYVADEDVVTPVEEKEAGEVEHQEVFTPRLDEADDTAPSGPVEFGVRPQHVDADTTVAARPEDEGSGKASHGSVIQFAAARRIHLPRLDDGEAAPEVAPDEKAAESATSVRGSTPTAKVPADDPDATVAATGEVLSELVREGRMGLDVNQGERDASLPDQDSAGLYSLGDELGNGKAKAEGASDAPTPVDDPTWGQSTYSPSASPIARRASLLDLPDPSQDEVDPLADTDGTRVQPRRRYNRRKGASGGDLDGFGGSDDGHWKGGATPRSDLRLVADEGSDDGREGAPGQAPDETELRESVTSMGTDELLCHDIWFVALGASEFDHAGMKAFLDAHRSDIRGAFLVNLDCVGAGDLTLLTSEGLLGTRHADRRLVRMLRSIASDFHVKLGLEDHDWEDTDATPAMRRSVRAVSIVGLDELGLPAYEGSPYDELDVIDADQVALVNDMVTELIRRS